MKYLRKFNESASGELDFETFKDIMLELSDIFSCEFNDYTNNEDYVPTDGGRFYDCQLTIPYLDDYAINDDNPDFNFDYLGYQNDGIEPIDEPGDIKSLYQDSKIYDTIDDQSDKLEKLKRDLDLIIESNNKMKSVFNIIEEHILPRFESYSNFLQCDCGFDSVNSKLRITFELKD